MYVPEDYRKCVVFLCTNDVDDSGNQVRIPRATAFFMGVRIEHDIGAVYLVTARHNIEESRQYGELFIRFNKVGGGFHYESVDQDSFVCHPSTDVAVFQLPGIKEKVEIHCIRMPVDVALMNIIPTKEGAEVVIAGLFSEYSGVDRNQPILRFGKISLAQPEKIPLRLSPNAAPNFVDAILVESMSWGGESGSPVFVDASQIFPPGELYPFGFLGLVHGHYPITQEVKHQMEAVGQVDLNAGIMAVIPADAIVETLELEEVVEKRNKIIEDRRKEGTTPTPDFLITDKPVHER